MSVAAGRRKATGDSHLFRRAVTMLCLVLAGEAIYFLPFQVSRHYRPTFVEVFGIDQTELGVLGSIYGIVATFAYILGGGLADRFQPRKLLAFSLMATGASGLYLATIPTYAEMCVLYAFWGVSTILPFWSALIRATREWGSHDTQGSAFGLLDGGRGLMASLWGLAALGLFAICFPDDGQAITGDQRVAGLQSVIYVYTTACFVAAAAVYLLIPDMDQQAFEDKPEHRATGHFLQCLAMPAVWLQAVIIIAAYSIFKGRDFYTQYAHDVWGWSEVNTAGFSTLSMWVRPLAALGAGLFADRLTSVRVVLGCFTLTAVTYISFLCSAPPATPVAVLWANVMISCLGMFALRGVYFALLEESHVPRHLTGTAVGVVSFIGFTPEIYMPLLGGWLIDHWQGGPTGYTVLFGFLLIVSLVGLAATLLLRRLHR